VGAAEKITVETSEALTWAQICERYPDQWVCVVEIQRASPGAFEIQSARVIGHGRSRREPLEQAEAWEATYSMIGHYYTGKLRAPVPRFPRIVMTDEIRELIRNRR
jgi:hypothetical protein